MSQQLSAADPVVLQEKGEVLAMRAFQNAAQKVPAYSNLLRSMGINPKTIIDIQSFRESVPVLTKDSLFSAHSLRELCIDGNLDEIHSFYSSSGHSGAFSYGVETKKNQRQSALAIDFLLELAFSALTRKTLLINCLPMGVKIHTNSIALAETSVRTDVVHALLKKLQHDYDQFLLVGESPFLKILVEEGIRAGVPWAEMVVHVITGGEFIAENWRSYLGSLLGIDFNRPENGMILVNMGLSEISNSIFFENPQGIRLRRAAQDNKTLRENLFGTQSATCPLIMQYFPQRFHLESLHHSGSDPTLGVTVTDPKRKLPIIRYDTGDSVQLIQFADMEQRLAQCGMADSLSPFRLPYGFVWGKRQSLVCDNQHVSPNAVKEALYLHTHHARLLTGNFRLIKKKEQPTVFIQMRPDTVFPSCMHDDMIQALNIYCDRLVEPVFVDYHTFGHGIEHNFEKKNRYI